VSRTSDLWASIDPAAEWRVQPTGGYSENASPAALPSAASGSPFYSPKHQHFGFLVLLAGTGGILYYIFEHKPSGALLKGNVGPLEGEVGAGLGEE